MDLDKLASQVQITTGIAVVVGLATIAGAQPASLPVLVYAHGGDNGVDIDETLLLLPLLLASDLQNFVFVAPSFRAEPLTFQGMTYVSGGPASPWDRDVDDALALINVVAATVPEADPDRIGVAGFSRGACVAMLMAERDPLYREIADHVINTDGCSPRTVAQRLVKELQ